MLLCINTGKQTNCRSKRAICFNFALQVSSDRNRYNSFGYQMIFLLLIKKKRKKKKSAIVFLSRDLLFPTTFIFRQLHIALANRDTIIESACINIFRNYDFTTLHKEVDQVCSFTLKQCG